MDHNFSEVEMSFQVEIDDVEVEHRQGVTKEGHAWERYQQSAWLHYGPKHPVHFILELPDSKPYPAGRYTIAPGSLGSDKFGRVEFGKIKIRAVSAASISAMGKTA